MPPNDFPHLTLSQSQTLTIDWLLSIDAALTYIQFILNRTLWNVNNSLPKSSEAYTSSTANRCVKQLQWKWNCRHYTLFPHPGLQCNYGRSPIRDFHDSEIVWQAKKKETVWKGLWARLCGATEWIQMKLTLNTRCYQASDTLDENKCIQEWLRCFSVQKCVGRGRGGLLLRLENNY